MGPAELFDLEEGEAVGLGDFDYGGGEDGVGEDFGKSVEKVGYYPVKHFDEEGKFLEDA